MRWLDWIIFQEWEAEEKLKPETKKEEKTVKIEATMKPDERSKRPFLRERWTSFQDDPTTSGRLVFQTTIEGCLSQEMELDTGSPGNFISRDVFDKLPKHVRKALPEAIGDPRYEDFGQHPLETSGAYVIKYTIGEVEAAGKFSILENQTDTFLLGLMGLRAQLLGIAWKQ